MPPSTLESGPLQAVHEGALIAGTYALTPNPTSAADRSYELRIALDGMSERTVTGHDIIDCISQIRRDLEAMSVRLCINACRENAVSSGMSRDMGGGALVYLASTGRSATMADLVPSLGPAPAELVVTEPRQQAWAKEWWEQRGLRR